MPQSNALFNETETFNVEFNGINSFDLTFPDRNAFDVTFESSSAMDVEFNGVTEFIADMTTVVAVLPNPYEGQYVVTPVLFQETVLPTTGKTMADDVVVEEIPYWETDNPSGGTTVYIAMEV